MIKTFCDICRTEITADNKVDPNLEHNRLKTTLEAELTRLEVEVVHSIDGAPNHGDVCKYCILDALYTLDDRPTKTAH